MLDEPLGLIMQGILLLAAGMYPVGFLFGACSDCCCPPCSKCSQYYAFDLDSTGQFCAAGPFSSIVMSYGSQSVAAVNVTPNPNDSVGGNWLPLAGPYSASGISPVEFSARLGYFEGPFGVPGGECVCPFCEYTLGVDLWLRESGSQLNLSGFPQQDQSGNNRWGVRYSGAAGDTVFFEYDRCNETSREFTLLFPGAWIRDRFMEYADRGFESALPETIDDVTLTLTFNLDEPCECGACCAPDGSYPSFSTTCEENVMESYCENRGAYLTGSNGTWQGDGVLCANVDCDEILGACCNEFEPCFRSTESYCVEEFAGNWQGPGTDCDPDPCT